MADALPIDATHTVPASAMTWDAVRASGPGGQHVNRTSSKVLLRFDPDLVDWLDAGARARLKRMAGTRRIDSDGCILISSQATRDQKRNLEDARDRLAELIRAALVRPKRRIATKPSKGSKERRLKGKREQSEKKRMRKRVDH